MRKPDEKWAMQKGRVTALLQRNQLAEAKALCIEICNIDPDNAETWNLLSSVNGMLGEIEEAASCCRRAIELQPQYAEAHVNLGNVLFCQGRRDEALEQYHTALRLDPTHVGAQNNIAQILSSMDKYGEAEACYAQIAGRNPDLVDVQYNLGNMQMLQNKYVEAVHTFRRILSLAPDSARVNDIIGHGPALMQCGHLEPVRALYEDLCRVRPSNPETWFLLSSVDGRCGEMTKAANSAHRAIELKPDYSAAHMNLAKALASLGRYEDAVTHYQTVLKYNPRVAMVHSELANALAALGRDSEAEACFAEALRIDPTQAGFHLGLGNLMGRQRRYDEAVHHYGEAIRLKPDYAAAYGNLGATLYAQNRAKPAVENLHRAIELDPGFADAYDKLAFVLRETNCLGEAEVLAKRALELHPDSAKAHYTLANIHHAQGRLGDAIEENRRVLELDPNHIAAHSAMLMCMEHRPEYSADDLRKASLEWAARHVHQVASMPPFLNPADPERRLRIGYVSADLRRHPVGHMMEPLLANHDRSHFEIFCYHSHTAADEVTQRLRASADHWRTIAELPDDEAARLIYDDQIDVLVDLSGHSAENRLLVLASKPAPVQATWLGYFGTTGVEAVDYIIADRYVIPPGKERHYVEKVMRLPVCYEIYPPPSAAVEVGPLPALPTGEITFGCFNNNAKITEKVVACWARLLHAVAGSRLCLKSMSYVDDGVAHRYTALFADHGIGRERLEFHGHSPRSDMLAMYNRVDIGLDPFPYNGGMTTFEALWMGVPVITLRGERFVSRMGESILSAAGLEQWVAASEAEYVAKAAALASDLGQLAALRRRLREQVVSSPLCDAAGFARAMEGAYRVMWQAWCHKPWSLPE